MAGGRGLLEESLEGYKQITLLTPCLFSDVTRCEQAALHNHLRAAMPSTP